MERSATTAAGRRLGVRTVRILALLGGVALLALAAAVQESWRLSPPVSRLAPRSRSEGPDPARAQARALPRGTAPGSSPVLITEVSATNRDVILDDDLAPSDWIELYNQTDRPAPLAGWRLVESGRPRRGWVFPGITLAPKAYVIVWASGKDHVSGAASRRVNTRLTRQARRYHLVDDFHTPLPGGFWEMREARRVYVDISVPGPGRYTLWMKAGADGLSGTVRVRVQGLRSTRVAVPGGRPHSLMVGAEGGVTIDESGTRTVVVVAETGTVDVIHLALVRAAAAEGMPDDDRYARHVHASFRLGHGREGVMLVDPTGVVRDEAPALDHPPTLTVQREPGAPGWRVAQATPAGRAFHAAPDLSTYPSLSPSPFQIALAPPPGVEELRYTLDGSVPTDTAPRLEGPLRVTRPTAFRLRGYSGGAPATPVVTRQFWVGPPPPAPTVMLALDPQLLSDPEIGIEPNDRWRRQQELPDDSALGPLRLTRRRDWARERRQWIKPADLLALDGEGLLFDGRARVRRFTMAVGPGFGLHIRTHDPFRPSRDVFGRRLLEPGRTIVIDEDDLNVPAYDAVRAAGGVSPLTEWGLLAVNGRAPGWRVLLEPIDDDFLKSRWGHARFDVLKGKTFAVKRGDLAAYDALVHRVEEGVRTAADVERLIDLPHLTALHFTALFLATGHNHELWQTYFVVDHDQVPPLIHAVGWDLDNTIKEGPDHETFAMQRTFARRVPEQDTYLGVLVMLALLDQDPAFRQRYLRYAERMMNHVLTPAWWDASRRAAGGPADPARAEQVARFLRERPAFLSRSLARDLGLSPPRVVRVGIQGDGGLTIDGYAHRGPYVGRYFEGGTLELVVPPERRAAFRGYTVNGQGEPGPALRLPVTGDLEVVARFGD
jgi:hypothetical protein